MVFPLIAFDFYYGRTSWTFITIAIMGLTKEDLLAHSLYIRNTLAPRIAKDHHLLIGEHAFDLSNLRFTLEELQDVSMTTEVLRFSRIEKALQRIVEASGAGWPPDLVSKANDLLARWEELLGPLQRVRTDFWAIGGRLEGLLKPRDWQAEKAPETPAWTIEPEGNSATAHKEGHSDFQVGQSVITPWCPPHELC